MADVPQNIRDFLVTCFMDEIAESGYVELVDGEYALYCSPWDSAVRPSYEASWVHEQLGVEPPKDEP